MPASPTPTELSRPGRAELLWVAGAILIGMILRLAYPGRMAIEHFDEGVYASNFWFGAEEGYEYPARYLYAPPLLPATIEWTMIIASMCGVRPTGFIPMIPSLVAGLASIPSIWWVGRRWFGPSAGVVSAWLVAASDFHASYSRAALTDVPVCLFILWGTYFTWQALQTGTRRSIGLAALFTALAWWTKYNGWLPLAIGITGGVAWQITLPRSDRELVQVAKRWLLVAGFSFLFWSPVLIGLQKHGGYAVVAANHRQYVEGFAKWPANAAEQLDHIADYENPFRAAFDSVEDQQGRFSLPVRISIWVARLPPLLLLAGMIFVGLFANRCGISIPTVGSNWALLAWIGGLTLATPTYHPYPRLVMPWMFAAWLGCGLLVKCAIDSCVIFALKPAGPVQPWRIQWLELGVFFWLFAGAAVRCQTGTGRAWEDRSKLAESVELIALQVKRDTAASGYPEEEGITYVQGAPAVVFGLRGQGLPLAVPVQEFHDEHPRPTFFVNMSVCLPDAHSRMFYISDDCFEYKQSSLVKLDGYTPDGIQLRRPRN